MRFAAVIIASLAAAAAGYEGGSELDKVRSVYLLPMGNGLDQYLANRLTQLGMFQVVTDASKADAVVTDRLGEAFERRLDELVPAPAAEPAGKAAAAAQPEGAKEAKPATPAEGKLAEIDIPEGAPVRPFSSGRAKGTIFLVSPLTRAVLWSTFERPKESTPEHLNRTAARIAERLERDVKRKPAQ